MSLHHVFALDNIALAGLPEAGDPTFLHESIGDTLASFNGLYVVEAFDERHWAVLEKVGIVKR